MNEDEVEGCKKSKSFDATADLKLLWKVVNEHALLLHHLQDLEKSKKFHDFIQFTDSRYSDQRVCIWITWQNQIEWENWQDINGEPTFEVVGGNHLWQGNFDLEERVVVGRYKAKEHINQEHQVEKVKQHYPHEWVVFIESESIGNNKRRQNEYNHHIHIPHKLQPWVLHYYVLGASL